MTNDDHKAKQPRVCVTHHHACDCREAKFAELASQLAEANAKYDVAGASKLCEAYTIMAIENGRMHKQVQALQVALRHVHCDISRRMASDDACGHPFDEDLAEALKVIEALQVKPKTEGEL